MTWHGCVNPIGLDRVDEGPPIALVLIGIGHGEFCDRFVEFGSLPDIGRDRHCVAGAGMGA